MNQLSSTQLNHILGILGSPGPDDLNCIINEKVGRLLLVHSALTCFFSIFVDDADHKLRRKSGCAITYNGLAGSKLPPVPALQAKDPMEQALSQCRS